MKKSTLISRFTLLSLSVLLAAACGNNPKVIEAEDTGNSSTEQSTGIFNDGSKSSPQGDHPNPGQQGVPPVSKDVHVVVVKESLPAEKYIYLNVEEDGETYWLATLKQDVEIGGTYFYKDRLLKTNFESKEFNRIFDRIYLVSKIVPADHGSSMSMDGGMSQDASQESKPVDIEMHSSHADEPIQVEGSVPIKELVENPEKFAGQEIQLSGKVTKVNPNIMDRNWIHLKDGTKDDYDLVLTSQEAIPEGAIVSMRGTVTLDKDFGAGYRYDIIIENASLVK